MHVGEASTSASIPPQGVEEDVPRSSPSRSCLRSSFFSPFRRRTRTNRSRSPRLQSACAERRLQTARGPAVAPGSDGRVLGSVTALDAVAASSRLPPHAVGDPRTLASRCSSASEVLREPPVRRDAAAVVQACSVTGWPASRIVVPPPRGRMARRRGVGGHGVLARGSCARGCFRHSRRCRVTEAARKVWPGRRPPASGS